MTILGRHTIAETKALAKVLEFRFAKTDEVFQKIPDSYKTQNAARYAKLAADWGKAKKDFAETLSDVKTKLVIIKAAAGPMTPDDVIPSEDQYNKLLAHTAQAGRNGDDSEYMTRRYVEQITGIPVDFSAQPSQDVNDVDFNAYKKVDTAIKEGEKKAGDAAKSNTTLLVAGGAVGALVLVGLAKVYL